MEQDPGRNAFQQHEQGIARAEHHAQRGKLPAAVCGAVMVIPCVGQVIPPQAQDLLSQSQLDILHVREQPVIVAAGALEK